MVQTLEAIKDGGGSIKVGTTGTINVLMSRELESVKVAPPQAAPSTLDSQRTTLEPYDAAMDIKPRARVQADEASTSSSNSSGGNTMNEKQTSISQKTKHHHARKGSRKGFLRSDSVSTEGNGTPDRRKNEKKGSCMVEIVDVKCGVPDKTWANPITNRFKKLGFSKLSEPNGVK